MLYKLSFQKVIYNVKNFQEAALHVILILINNLILDYDKPVYHCTSRKLGIVGDNSVQEIPG